MEEKGKVDLLIKGGRVIDPSQGLDGKRDILASGGKIREIGDKISSKGKDITVIDASGLIVCPGLIDMHTHLREPGREDEETIETASHAAAAGGFTSIVAMPNTDPVNDNGAITDFIHNEAKKRAIVNVFCTGSITKGMKQEQLSELGELAHAGCVGFTEDGYSVKDSDMMRRAMEYIKMFDLPVISHCEDKSLSRNGVMHEGFISTELGLAGIPRESEEIMAAHDIILSKMTGVKLHITHVSSAGTVELIRNAKKKGLTVTADATPHHFSLTDESVRGYDSNFKVNPPLREKSDVKAIIKGLKDGTIDAIATDHAPHHLAEKDVEFNLAPFGLIGLQTALPLALKLYHSGELTLNDIIRLLTKAPREILNLKKGSLAQGSDADITIINPDLKFHFEEKDIKSLSRNSPFIGWDLKGKAVTTIVSGKIVYNSAKC